MNYELSYRDILEMIKKKPEILIIDCTVMDLIFSILITSPPDAAIGSFLDSKENFHIINMDKFTFPEFYAWNLAITNLIQCYGKYWIPTGSIDYDNVLKDSFIINPNMEVWQRGVRAINSEDKKELAQLTLDPNEDVRRVAKNRINQLRVNNG